MSARALSQLYDQALRPLGIRVTQFSMLVAIEAAGPVTFQKLAELLALDQTTMPRALRVLEKAGWVRIEPGEDKRERLVSLTERGGDVLEKSVPLWRSAQARLKATFPKGRLDRLMSDLAEMRRAAHG